MLDQIKQLLETTPDENPMKPMLSRFMENGCDLYSLAEELYLYGEDRVGSFGIGSYHMQDSITRVWNNESRKFFQLEDSSWVWITYQYFLHPPQKWLSWIITQDHSKSVVIEVFLLDRPDDNMGSLSQIFYDEHEGELYFAYRTPTTSQYGGVIGRVQEKHGLQKEPIRCEAVCKQYPEDINRIVSDQLMAHQIKHEIRDNRIVIPVKDWEEFDDLEDDLVDKGLLLKPEFKTIYEESEG